MKKGIAAIISLLVGITSGVIGAKGIMGNKLDEMKQLSDKHLTLFLMMNRWVKIKQEGKTLASYFQQNGYKRIAVYGMSYAGETLLKELEETEIQVVYGIDKRADSIYAGIDIVTTEDSLDNVDVIVVTAITFYDEIERILSEKAGCPIISLEDILYEM